MSRRLERTASIAPPRASHCVVTPSNHPARIARYVVRLELGRCWPRVRAAETHAVTRGCRGPWGVALARVVARTWAVSSRWLVGLPVQAVGVLSKLWE